MGFLYLDETLNLFEPEPEQAAPSRHGLDAERPIESLGDPSRYGEAQSDALRSRAANPLDPKERFENLHLFRRGQAASTIFHTEHDGFDIAL
jgi:hypothetical protein